LWFDVGFELGIRAPETSLSRKAQHLALIGAVTRRLSLGSLMLRLWSVLIVGALLAISENRVHARFAWLSLFAAIGFWLFDAYLLQQATLFRKLIDHVRSLSDSELPAEFLLDTSGVEEDRDGFGAVVFSTKLVVFYGMLIVCIAVLRACAWQTGG
jgi:hypothetical protein